MAMIPSWPTGVRNEMPHFVTLRVITAARNALVGAALIVLVAVSSLAITNCAKSAPSVDAFQLLKAAADKQTVVRTYTYAIPSGQTPQTEDDPAVFTSTVTGHVVVDQGVHLKIQTTLGYVEHLLLPDHQSLDAVYPIGLAGKPLAGFRTMPSRRITVLYGVIVYAIRFKTPSLHR